MNKNLLLKLLRSILRGGIKLLTFSLIFFLSVLFSNELRKKIREHEKRESDYDEYTASVTKRKFLF
jgi:hypothetical protein